MDEMKWMARDRDKFIKWVEIPTLNGTYKEL